MLRHPIIVRPKNTIQEVVGDFSSEKDHFSEIALDSEIYAQLSTSNSHNRNMDIEPPDRTFALIVTYYKDIASDSEKIVLLWPLVHHYNDNVRRINLILTFFEDSTFLQLQSFISKEM